MADLIEDVEVYPRMIALAGELERTLAARNIPAAVVTVLPEGIPALDYFGEDCEGYAWVRLTTANPYRTFPLTDETAGTCESLIAYGLEVGYAHCAPMMDGDGNPPTAEEQMQATRIQTSAMTAMRAAIKATMNALDTPYVLGQYQAILSGGGMLGATWTVTIGDRRG